MGPLGGGVVTPPPVTLTADEYNRLLAEAQLKAKFEAAATALANAAESFITTSYLGVASRPQDLRMAVQAYRTLISAP